MRNKILTEISYLLQNWKTTSAGLLLIIGSIVHMVFSIKSGLDNESTWNTGAVGILGGIGLLFAGDASQSTPVVPPAPVAPVTPVKP